jgi:hypothetical protein
MGLQEIVVLIHNGEYGRAISDLEHEVSNGNRSPPEKLEYCEWLAECNTRLGDHKEAGNWYLEAVKMVLAQRMDGNSKAKQALPLCGKALECYKQGGDSVDVLVAARLKQYLLELSR